METKGEAPVVTTSSTDKDFAYWRARPYLSGAARSEIAAAEVLVVPAEGFRDYSEPVFPHGSDELYEFLREQDRFSVEVCIDDDKYAEYSLYGALLTIATLVVTSIVAPIVVAQVNEYLKRRREKRISDDTVRFSMIVDRGAHGCTQIKYEGPAPLFGVTVEKALEAAMPSSTHALPPHEAKDE